MRFTPQFLRVYHRRGERRSPYDGHPPDAPTIETIVPVTFYEIIKIERKEENPQPKRKIG